MDLSPKSSPTRENDPAARVEALVQEFLRRFAAGENPDPDVIAAEHPALAPELAHALAKARRIALARRQAPGPADDSSAEPSSERSQQTSRSQLDETTPPDHPWTAPRSRTPELPEQFGRYRILKLLGQGAMGAVYLAEDTELKRKVALKAPKIHEEDGPEAIARFYREARLAATLRHPHICPVYDIGQIEGVLFISMAYIEGKPLSAYISSDKPPSERSCATVVRKLALALAEAHALGIIHRDLKPANVMIDKKGEPVVMDFGLAHHDNGPDTTRLTQAGAIVGSPAYMAPEQVLSSSDLTPSADIYSLGVILYELLTGSVPFQGSLTTLLKSILHEEPPAPSSHRASLDPKIEAICLRMLSKRPEGRYPGMSAVAEALMEFLKKSAASSSSTAALPKVAARQSDDVFAGLASQPPPVPPPAALIAAPPVVDVAAPPAEHRTAPEDLSPGDEPRAPAPSLPFAPRNAAAGQWPSEWKIMAAAAGVLAPLILLGAFFVIRTEKGENVIEAPRWPNAEPLEPETVASISLFNGDDLRGWKAVGGDAWQVKDGTIDNARGVAGAYLATEKQFSNFELELEYRLSAGGNSGVYFRAPDDLEPNSVKYLEVQLLDAQKPPFAFKADRVNGALYGLVAVSQEAPPLPAQWNRLVLRANGDRVAIHMNGVQVVDADLAALRQEHPEIPGLAAREGHILLQYHTGTVAFRNIRIRELGPSADTASDFPIMPSTRWQPVAFADPRRIVRGPDGKPNYALQMTAPDKVRLLGGVSQLLPDEHRERQAAGVSELGPRPTQ